MCYEKVVTCQVSENEELTKAGVDEAVPVAAAGSQQPLSTNAGSEAECGAEHTHQHVADTYI